MFHFDAGWNAALRTESAALHFSVLFDLSGMTRNLTQLFSASIMVFVWVRM